MGPTWWGERSNCKLTVPRSNFVGQRRRTYGTWWHDCIWTSLYQMNTLAMMKVCTCGSSNKSVIGGEGKGLTECLVFWLKPEFHCTVIGYGRFDTTFYLSSDRSLCVCVRARARLREREGGGEGKRNIIWQRKRIDGNLCLLWLQCIFHQTYFGIVYGQTRYGQVMLQEWKMKEFPKKFVMGNFIVQDQWENQEIYGRVLSRGAHHRS